MRDFFTIEPENPAVCLTQACPGLLAILALLQMTFSNSWPAALRTPPENDAKHRARVFACMPLASH